jgi:hypothetical protein
VPTLLADHDGRFALVLDHVLLRREPDQIAVTRDRVRRVYEEARSLRARLVAFIEVVLVVEPRIDDL